MCFRLLYCCHIWDASFSDAPKQEQLPPVASVVFDQGLPGWTSSTDLADLFPEAMRSWPWVPRFEHVLLDQTEVGPGAVAGGAHGRMAQLLMMAFRRDAEAALDLAARLMASLLADGGASAAGWYIVYLMATQDEAVVEAFGESLRDMGMQKEARS